MAAFPPLHKGISNVLVLIFVAGKTTLCAHLVNALRSDKTTTTTTLYYFCGSPANSHTDCSRILRSLATQLIRYEPALATHVCMKFVRQGVSASVAQLRKILPDLLSAVPILQILLDGLDECDPSSQAQILSEFLTFSNSSIRLSKVLISSREGGVIGKKLRQKSTLSLREESQAVENDINIFVKITLQQTRSEWSFDVSESCLAKIEEELLRLSNGEQWLVANYFHLIQISGMFLWVQLVIVTLQYQYTEDDLLSALNRLPGGLQEALALPYYHSRSG